MAFFLEVLLTGGSASTLAVEWRRLTTEVGRDLVPSSLLNFSRTELGESWRSEFRKYRWDCKQTRKSDDGQRRGSSCMYIETESGIETIEKKDHRTEAKFEDERMM